MPVWFAAVLAAIFSAGGILSLRAARKTGKRTWKFAGIAMFLLCAGCIFYLTATLLLLGSIG